MFRNKQLPRSNIKHKLTYDINTIRVKNILRTIDDNKKKRHMIIAKRRNDKIILFTALPCLEQKKDEITNKHVKAQIPYDRKYNKLKKEYNDLVNSATFSRDGAKSHLLLKYINTELFIQSLNTISDDFAHKIKNRIEKKELDKLKKALEKKEIDELKKAEKKRSEQKDDNKGKNIVKPSIGILTITSGRNLTKADIKDEFTIMLKSNSYQSVYRQLSLKYHPDKCGTNEHFNWLSDIYKSYGCR